SRQHELIALLWPFPADVGKAVAVTFLQPVNRKMTSWTAAIKIPDHRTVSPQRLARVPRSGNWRGGWSDTRSGACRGDVRRRISANFWKCCGISARATTRRALRSGNQRNAPAKSAAGTSGDASITVLV